MEHQTPFLRVVHSKPEPIKAKLFLLQVLEAHTVVRHRGSHIFWAVGSQMAVMSVLRAVRPLTPDRFLVFISVRGSVDPRTVLRLEGLGQLENPITSTGIEPVTFRLVA
jgi:hypothetical protein